MYEYKSYSYIIYIKSLPYDEFIEIFDLCLKRKVMEIEKIEDDRLWQAYLINENAKGYTFEEWKKSLSNKTVRSENNANEIKNNSDKLRKLMDIEDLKITRPKINVVVKE